MSRKHTPPFPPLNLTYTKNSLLSFFPPSLPYSSSPSLLFQLLPLSLPSSLSPSSSHPRSDDGLILVITSSDAYCSIVTFEPGELGTPLAKDKLPSPMRRQDVDGGERTCEVAKARKEGEAGKLGRKEDSPTVDKPKEKAAVAVKRDAKGKRRIQATMLESFTSPEHSNTHPTSPLSENISPSPPPGGQRSTSRPESTSSFQDQITSPKDGSSVLTTPPKNGSSVAVQPPPETKKPTEEKKPRRVQLVTLSTLSPKSCDSDSTSSHTHSSTMTPPPPADDISGSAGTGDKVEPMEVQIIE